MSLLFSAQFRKKQTDLAQSGQALLIVLLVMAVALTIVLSTASRTVTDVQNTSLEEDSLRAFSAAEAGVEESLLENSSFGPSSLGNNATYEVAYDGTTPNNYFHSQNEYLAGDTATIWFVRRDSNGDLTCSGGGCGRGNQIRLCWGDTGTVGFANDQAPALEVSIYYDTSGLALSSQDFSNVEVKRIGLDPNTPRSSTNGFSGALLNCTLTGSTRQYAFRNNVFFNASGLDIDNTCLTTDGCLLMARIRFLYNETTDHPLALRLYATGGTQLPPQGATISSTGNAGDSTRKIEVFQGFGEAPSIFESAVYSEQSITK